MSKVNIDDSEDGCWNWTGAIHKLGYGQFKFNGSMKRAHRVSYELVKGSIPKGLEIDHICRNRRCVYPDHLRSVTHKVNVLVGDSFMARRAMQTHCIHGHPLSGDNLITRPSGGRKCKTCQRAAERRYKKRVRSCVS